jgi:hypothetical protein
MSTGTKKQKQKKTRVAYLPTLTLDDKICTEILVIFELLIMF